MSQDACSVRANVERLTPEPRTPGRVNVVISGPMDQLPELGFVVARGLCGAGGLEMEEELAEGFVPGDCVKSVRHLMHLNLLLTTGIATTYSIC